MKLMKFCGKRIKIMNSKIVVSLLSEHSVPNILVIDFFKPDKLFFVGTEKTEKEYVLNRIRNTLYSIGQSWKDVEYKSIKVDPEIFDKILESLKKELENYINEDDEIIVNLTGGTKPMALAVYKFFSGYKSVSFVYLPYGKNEFIVFGKNNRVKLNRRITVRQYLLTYGININENVKKIQSKKEFIESMKENTLFIAENYKRVNPFLRLCIEKLRDKRNKDLKGEPIVNEIDTGINDEIIRRFGFEVKGNTWIKNFTKYEVDYFTGGWLEHLCYLEIEEKVKPDDMLSGIHISNTGNEFDVIFTKDNKVYLVECKTFYQNYNDILYKMKALKSLLGLKPKGFLVVTGTDIIDPITNEIKESIKLRAELYGIKIIRHENLREIGNIIGENL